MGVCIVEVVVGVWIVEVVGDEGIILGVNASLGHYMVGCPIFWKIIPGPQFSQRVVVCVGGKTGAGVGRRQIMCLSMVAV